MAKYLKFSTMIRNHTKEIIVITSIYHFTNSFIPYALCKENKEHKDRDAKIKLSLFFNNINIYVEIPKVPIKY